MAITYENNEATFSAVIYEDEVVSLRDFLQACAGEKVKFDFAECDDVHLAILQLIMAYKKNYDCVCEFGEETRLFQKVLEGFDASENHCN